MDDSDKNLELIRNDPESEAQFPLLRDIAEEELNVRLAMGGPLQTPEQLKVVAEFIADAILEAFEVRRRTADKPRHSWVPRERR